MQADAAHAGAALAFERREILRVDAVAHTHHPLARSAARGDASGDGGAVELGEERLRLGQGVSFGGIGLGAEAVALEEPRDASGELTHHPLDLAVLGGRQGMETKRAVRPALVDAVEEKRMEVDVQVQGVAEALHEGDRAALAAGNTPSLARPPPQRGEEPGLHHVPLNRGTRHSTLDGLKDALTPMQLRDFGRHERVETTESNYLASRPPVELAEVPTLLERLSR